MTAENVSRGTERPLLFRKPMRAAIAAGVKDTTRRIVAANNSTVHPGDFAGLDLSSGRARRLSHPEIRARCTFASGRVRVVTVSPIVRAGDLFYVKANRFTSKAKAEAWLRVLTVDVSRVQDMTDEEALREGVTFFDPLTKAARVEYSELSPREQFAVLWDAINGSGAWLRNDWVWIYRFRQGGSDAKGEEVGNVGQS